MHLDHPLKAVRERRQLLNIKASTIAASIGVNPITYYRFETGDRQPYFNYAIAIAKQLGCSLEDLGREPTDEERLAMMKQARERSGPNADAFAAFADWRDEDAN